MREEEGEVEGGEEVQGMVGEVVGEEENRVGWPARWLVRLRLGRVRLVILVSGFLFSFFLFFWGGRYGLVGGL